MVVYTKYEANRSIIGDDTCMQNIWPQNQVFETLTGDVVGVITRYHLARQGREVVFTFESATTEYDLNQLQRSADFTHVSSSNLVLDLICRPKHHSF